MTSTSETRTEMPTDKIKILLDTDIADDIDDAIALSFALASPEFQLLGVTTVYGDVDTRTRVARKLVRAWGRNDVPVVPGYERPFQFDWHEGTEPEVPSQRNAVADDTEPVDRSRTAPDFIAETVRRHPGEVYVLTIGACTNVAAALCANPSLAGAIPGVVSLVGYLPPRLDVPEWNVRYDPLAASAIARSGVRWTAIPANVQGENHLSREEFDALAASDRAPARLLVELIVLMKQNKAGGDPDVRSIADVTRAHVADVMTLASFLIPEEMALTPGWVDVDAVGALSFREDPAGPHRLARSAVAGTAYRAEILRRVLGGRLD